VAEDAPSVDWRARAIAAEARVEELTETLRLENVAWQSAHDESARLTGELFDATMKLVELRPLADLARKIGAAVRQYRDDGDMSALACLLDDAALLDQAAALAGKAES
jgi:hypothetical protein